MNAPEILALIEAAQLHVHHKLDVVTLVLPSDAAEPGAPQGECDSDCDCKMRISARVTTDFSVRKEASTRGFLS